MKITTMSLIKIVSLAFDLPEKEVEDFYECKEGGGCIFRDFYPKDMLISIMVIELRCKSKGIHFNIMKNGDVFAKDFPYYDGTIDLMLVKNQRKIFEIAKKVAKQKSPGI